MANEFVVKNGLISQGNVQVDSDLNVTGQIDAGSGTILTLGVDDFEISGYIKKTGSVTVSTTSASTEGVSILKVTGTGSPESFNLADGLDGQRLTVYSSGGTFGRTTISPISSSGWSSFEITAIGDCIDLIYDSTAGWIVTGNRGGTIL